jgi:tetratricopeptide (TPR) repeat protein/serine/threonine protein kinase
MKATPDTWVGRELAGGRYRVTAQLGEGGMGCVYRARDANLDCDVVIKVPRAAMLADPEFVGRFAREIRSLVRLAHPHVVKIIDVGQEDDVPFAVMQFLSGGSLERHKAGSASTPPALAAWLEPVAEALDYIHKQGYVHRDIKPANILFDAQGNAYVGDFGVAKTVAAGATERHAASLTETGMVLGTRHYMAPEMLLGEDYGGRIDQYALAVTVYEILSGRMPFDGPTPAAILLKQTSEEAAPLHRLVPSVPREVSAAVARALARDPARRFPSCLEFARAALQAGEPFPVSRVSARHTFPAVGTGEQKIACPECGKTYTLPARALKKKRLRCPRCQNVFPVAPASEPVRRPSPAAETGCEVQARTTTERARPVRETPRPTSAPRPATLPAPLPETTDWRADPELAPPVGRRPWTWVVAGLTALLAVTLIGVGLWRWLASPPASPGDAGAAAEAKSSAGGEQGFLERGQAHVREHEFDRAIPLFQEALRLNPKSAAAHAGLAEAYLAERNDTQAMQECNEAIGINPNLAQAHLVQGRVYAVQKDYIGAQAAYDEALRLDPKLALAYVHRGLARAARGDADGCLKDCDEALRLEPKLAAAYAALSYARHVKREDDLAVANATEAIRLDPKSAWAYQTRGSAYLGKPDYDKAIADFDEAVRLDPGYAYAYYVRGSAYTARGEYDRAIADYDQAIRRDRRDAGPYTGRASAYLAKKDYDHAIADCTEALGLDPKQVPALLTRGIASSEKGDHDRAVADYNQALQLDPQSAVAYANRAYSYLARKDYGHAIADGTEAIRLDAKLALAYTSRGAAYYATGAYDRAIADFTEAVRLDPRDVRAYGGRAAAYGAAHDYERAIADYTAALRIDPTDAALYKKRADAYYSGTKDLERTIDDLTEAIRLSPRDASLYVARGEAYTMRGGLLGGDLDRAVADLTDALRLDRTSPRAFNDLGYVYLLQKKYDHAIAQLNEAIRLDPNNEKAYANRALAYERKNLTQRAEEDRGAIRRISGNRNK